MEYEWDPTKIDSRFFEGCKNFEDKYMRVEGLKMINSKNKMEIDIAICRKITGRLQVICILLILILSVLLFGFAGNAYIEPFPQSVKVLSRIQADSFGSFSGRGSV